MKMQICNPVSRIKSAITRARHSHTSQSHVTPIDHSDLIDILSCTRRRWAVEYLAGQPPNEVVTISDLSEHVAARENNCTVTELSSKQRERVYVSLYQTHLLTMEELIDYNRDRGTITPTEAPERLWTAYRAFCETLDG
ncbi:hypothetical protein ACERIT_08840 [Halopenitus sp. H-Gu1]|uniref:DUF7344 domain-containing protein n=1 Tax=Halopenitus sp. H-Gu1 TaxID=3242697 RepID=UPI00359EEA81